MYIEVKIPEYRPFSVKEQIDGIYDFCRGRDSETFIGSHPDWFGDKYVYDWQRKHDMSQLKSMLDHFAEYLLDSDITEAVDYLKSLPSDKYIQYMIEHLERKIR